MFYDVSYNQNTYKPHTSFECCDFLNVCLKYPFLRLRTSRHRPPHPRPVGGNDHLNVSFTNLSNTFSFSPVSFPLFVSVSFLSSLSPPPITLSLTSFQNEENQSRKWITIEIQIQEIPGLSFIWQSELGHPCVAFYIFSCTDYIRIR